VTIIVAGEDGKN